MGLGPGFVVAEIYQQAAKPFRAFSKRDLLVTFSTRPAGQLTATAAAIHAGQPV
jgi:hypothetical protein